MTLIPSRHTLLLANTPIPRMLILIPSRTHNTSQQNTQINLFNRIQGLHLLQKQIYKQKSYLTLFDQSQSLSNLNSLKNSKTCVKILLLKYVFMNIFKDIVCYQILTNLFIAFKKIGQSIKDWSAIS